VVRIPVLKVNNDSVRSSGHAPVLLGPVLVEKVAVRLVYGVGDQLDLGRRLARVAVDKHLARARHCGPTNACRLQVRNEAVARCNGSIDHGRVPEVARYLADKKPIVLCQISQNGRFHWKRSYYSKTPIKNYSWAQREMVDRPNFNPDDCSYLGVTISRDGALPFPGMGGVPLPAMPSIPANARPAGAISACACSRHFFKTRRNRWGPASVSVTSAAKSVSQCAGGGGVWRMVNVTSRTRPLSHQIYTPHGMCRVVSICCSEARTHLDNAQRRARS
jgi:hypothetical protein